jgi:hypothetical protein
MYKYFTETFLPANPEFAKGLEKAKELTDTYRFEGAENRASANMSRYDIRKRMKELSTTMRQTSTQLIDEATPLIHLTRDIEALTGTKLKPGEDPAQVYSYLRGNAQAKTHYMVFDGMVDAAGNRTGPALADSVAVARENPEKFVQYLWARRALERWSKGKNPGMTKEDAQFLFDQLDSPEYQIAAQGVYDWNAGVLNYVKGLVPDLAPAIDGILKNSQDYVPLMREFEETDGPRLLGKYQQGNALFRMKGSGRRVKDIFPQMIANAEKLIGMAHKKKVLDTIVRLEQLEGVGSLLEKVPKDKVPVNVEISKIAKSLEAWARISLK